MDGEVGGCRPWRAPGEVIGDPGDVAGDGAAYHLFTVVNGKLKLVTGGNCSPGSCLV